MTVDVLGFDLEVSLQGLPFARTVPATPVARETIEEVCEIYETCCVVLDHSHRYR